MAFFSVIIPNYNTEGYICRCLKAIERQTFKDFEVIIVDDCSTDDSLKVINEYIKTSNCTIRVLKNEKNLGPSKSREKGILHSEGTYIAFCDSDDWYDEDYLKLAFGEIESNKADMVFQGFKTVKKKNGDWKITEHPLYGENRLITKSEALTLPIDGLCFLVVKKDVALKIEAPDIRNGEDMALIPMLICASDSLAIVTRVCPYNYFYREGSASMTANLNVVDSLIASYEFIYKALSNCYPIECEYLGIRNLLYGAVLNLFKFSYNTKKAEAILNSFSEKYPNWQNNPLYAQLPLYKKLVVMTATKRQFFITAILARVHTFLTV